MSDQLEQVTYDPSIDPGLQVENGVDRIGLEAFAYAEQRATDPTEQFKLAIKYLANELFHARGVIRHQQALIDHKIVF